MIKSVWKIRIDEIVPAFSLSSLNFHIRAAREALVVPSVRRQGELIEGATVELFLGWEFYIPSESHFFQCSDYDPAEVKLPPFESMSGRGWKGVMIVMPTLTMA